MIPKRRRLPRPPFPTAQARPNSRSPIKPASGAKLPNQVELGKYQLKFNAGHTSDVVPRTGLDSGETSNLSKVVPGQKTESVAPDYFGLKLSTPTR